MTREEIRLQAALTALQGIIEAKGGFIGEALPYAAAKEAIRIADAFCETWFNDKENGN